MNTITQCPECGRKWTTDKGYPLLHAGTNIIPIVVSLDFFPTIKDFIEIRGMCEDCYDRKERRSEE